MSVLEYTQGYSKLLEAKTLAELMTTNPHPTNCPNCGAPLPSSGKCEYCGTECIQDG
jgi:tRNA(Ile2) C34 agmatinyltransferase TiaS